jgi:putative ABC transport system permease protein
MYLPYRQVHYTFAFSPRALVLRASGDPTALTGAVREAVRRADPEQPVSRVRTLEEVLDSEMTQRSTAQVLLGALAALALTLAAVGIYGVLSYAVAQRTSEIGVRMALGAEPADLLLMGVGQGMRLAACGVLVGLAASVGLTRAMSSLLFGASPTDPATLAIVSAGLLATAFAASYIPARRATRVDPIRALRQV